MTLPRPSLTCCYQGGGHSDAGPVHPGEEMDEAGGQAVLRAGKLLPCTPHLCSEGVQTAYRSDQISRRGEWRQNT